MHQAISKAEALEKKGLWRRAATQWLEVMGYNLNNAQLDEIRQRRKFCLSQLKPLEKPKRLNLSALNKAAGEAQRRMGIVRQKKDFTRNVDTVPGVYAAPNHLPGKFFNRNT